MESKMHTEIETIEGDLEIVELGAASELTQAGGNFSVEPGMEPLKYH